MCTDVRFGMIIRIYSARYMYRHKALSVLLLATAVLAGCQGLAPFDRRKESDSVYRAPVADQTDPIKTTVSASHAHDTPPVKQHEITIREQLVQTPAHVNGRLVLGISEQATLPNQNFSIAAKLDTGAANSSIDARNIQYFERDGKKWVKFDVARTSAGTVNLEMPLKNVVRIKRPGLPALERPVVNMTITVGEITQSVPVSLIDRSKYSAPLLIGRSFMQDLAVIDVNQANIASKVTLRTTPKKAVVPVTQKSFTQVKLQPVQVDGLALFGATEEVELLDEKLTIKGRIDTGARTSSLDARNVELFEHAGKDWVRFDLMLSENVSRPVEYPVSRMVKIKRHGEEAERRPVITMNVKIGQVETPAEFTLRSREDYDYPVLIGSRFLEKRAMVDVSQEYVADAAK